MTLTEKVAYLKGLAEGLCLDDSKGEVRLIKGIIKVLDEMSISIMSVEESAKALSEQVDAVDEDLDALEAAVYGDDADEDSDGDDADEDEDVYEVECPACGEVIYLDESVLDEGHIDCPNCGENLEFDMEGIGDKKPEEEEKSE